MAHMDSYPTMTNNNILPGQFELIKLFSIANQLPQILFTQNSQAMQAAFLKVPQSVWMTRLNDLQIALKSKSQREGVKLFLLNRHDSNLLPGLETLLDAVFMEKYLELVNKVQFDYGGFFPYKITRMNQKLLVFEKLEYMELNTYIVSHKP